MNAPPYFTENMPSKEGQEERDLLAKHLPKLLKACFDEACQQEDLDTAQEAFDLLDEKVQAECEQKLNELKTKDKSLERAEEHAAEPAEESAGPPAREERQPADILEQPPDIVAKVQKEVQTFTQNVQNMVQKSQQVSLAIGAVNLLLAAVTLGLVFVLVAKTSKQIQTPTPIGVTPTFTPRPVMSPTGTSTPTRSPTTTPTKTVTPTFTPTATATATLTTTLTPEPMGALTTTGNLTPTVSPTITPSGEISNTVAPTTTLSAIVHPLAFPPDGATYAVVPWEVVVTSTVPASVTLELEAVDPISQTMVTYRGTQVPFPSGQPLLLAENVKGQSIGGTYHYRVTRRVNEFKELPNGQYRIRALLVTNRDGRPDEEQSSTFTLDNSKAVPARVIRFDMFGARFRKRPLPQTDNRQVAGNQASVLVLGRLERVMRDGSIAQEKEPKVSGSFGAIRDARWCLYEYQEEQWWIWCAYLDFNQDGSSNSADMERAKNYR